MKQFKVTGMSCTACVARVEQAVSKVPGVTSCSVSLLTNSMGIEGQALDEDIIKAVIKAGYNANLKNNDKTSTVMGENSIDDELENSEMPILKKRLLFSSIFLFLLMYFSMWHTMLGFKVPELFEKNVVALGILELLFSVIIMVINQKFFISGFKSLVHFTPNMDTLVALGSMVSFIYSVWTLFMMTSAQMSGEIMSGNAYKDGLYFESAAMILTLITVGKTLEARSKGKTTDALKNLIRLAPKTATVIRDGQQQVISINQVKVNDIFVVKPGDSIPVDGIVLEGNSAVNEASLTGESIPVDKKPGDDISTATINQSGYMKCRATRVGKDTTLSQIIDMVSDAAATKAPISKAADKVAGVFVPCVLIISAITFIIWICVGADLGNALSYAISVLVISCPCSLGLATPVAIMVGNGVGAKNGILFKTAASLEGTGRIQIAALDKTGTITKGEPSVTDIVPVGEEGEKKLLSVAYVLESKSEHPLAKAVVEKALNENIELKETTEAMAIPGKGLLAKLEGERIYGGSETFIKEKVTIPVDMELKINQLSKEGKTPLLFATDNGLLGMIAVADVIKEDAKEAINQLKNMGICVVMITGDNERTARAVANQVGIKDVVAGVLPSGKENVIRKLQKYGKVAMIGDGINDAPALTRADIGIAIGSGTDIAIDAAEVVLLKNDLRKVPSAMRLGRATLRNVHENLFWAFFYNSVSIPIAAGLFASTFGIRLNPMIGAAAMSLSSFCVVTNALRLNLINIYDGKKDKKIKNKIVYDLFKDDDKNYSKMEEKMMTKTIKITGMMCPHCEARVKDALERIEGVEAAVVNYENGTAVVHLSEEVANEALQKVIEDEKYTVIEIFK